MVDVAKRNELSMEKLRAQELYINQMRNVERILDEFRYNLSKTKALIGFTLANSSVIDLRELDPSERVEIESKDKKQLFRLERKDTENEKLNSKEDGDGLRKRTTNKNSAEDSNEETPTGESGNGGRKKSSEATPTVFRPFGLLEPISAKHARQNIKSVLPLLCELANLQQEIRQINSAIDDVSAKMSALKVNEASE